MATPTKGGTPAKGTTTFTQRDLEMLSKAFTCMKGDVAIDYPKFALATGLANANSAKASWHGLKKKIDKMSGDSQSDAGDDTPKKRKADSDGDANGNGEEDATPATKKTRTPAKPKAKATPKMTEGENDSGDAVVKAETEGEEGGELAAAAPAVATPKARKRAPAKAKATPKAADGDGDGVHAEVKAKKDVEDGDKLATAAPAVATPKARKSANPKAKTPAKKVVKQEETAEGDGQVRGEEVSKEG